MEKKTIVSIIGILAITILLTSGVYAKEYILFCLDNGDTIEFSLCSGNNDVTCDSDSCTVCAYKGSGGDYYCPATANPNPCNALGLSCSGSTGGNTTFDKTNPNVTIVLPYEGYISKDRRVNVQANATENSFFKYSVNGGNFKTMCAGYSMICEKEVNLDEGENVLVIKAIDSAKNEGTNNITITVDSKDPKILRTLPSRGFSNGDFEVQFKEDTPTNLTLYYGNSTDMQKHALNITGECTPDGTKYDCSTSVNVNSYNEQEIEYYFTLKDIANNTEESKHYTLDVDNAAPKILNGEDFYEVDGKYIYFNIEVDESNFDKATYVDSVDSREKTLCSRLKNGVCEKKIILKDGTHNITLYLLDEAGNLGGITIENIFIDSKSPKIKKTEPRRGFADGNFYVEFQEENPENLTLYYGNSTNMQEYKVDIENECEIIKGRSDKQGCNVYRNLTTYSGQEIKYYFILTDKVGSFDEYRHYEIDVDTDSPEINNPTSFYWNDSNYIYFNISIAEANLDEVVLNYEYERHGKIYERERRLCSRLKEGICENRFRYKDYYENYQLTILDEAGNFIGVPVVLK